jgi:ribosomal protein S18 acetylase RimI-like enzyme
MNDDLQIIPLEKSRIDDLAPLWKALHRHHMAIGSNLGPMRTEEESWECRRNFYEKCFQEDGTFALMASYNNVSVGYAFVTSRRIPCSFLSGEKIAELQTLSVLEDYRSHGVGNILMQKVFEVLRERGITEVSLGVVVTNERVIRFYERYGFKTRYVAMWGKVPNKN